MATRVLERCHRSNANMWLIARDAKITARITIALTNELVRRQKSFRVAWSFPVVVGDPMSGFE